MTIQVKTFECYFVVVQFIVLEKGCYILWILPLVVPTQHQDTLKKCLFIELVSQYKNKTKFSM